MNKGPLVKFAAWVETFYERRKERGSENSAETSTYAPHVTVVLALCDERAKKSYPLLVMRTDTSSIPGERGKRWLNGEPLSGKGSGRECCVSPIGVGPQSADS